MALSTTYTALRKRPLHQHLSKAALHGPLANKLIHCRSGMLSQRIASADYSYILFPGGKSASQNPPEISQEELESQLHTELLHEPETICPRIRMRHKSDTAGVHKIIKAREQLEAIDFWERRLNEVSYRILFFSCGAIFLPPISGHACEFSMIEPTEYVSKKMEHIESLLDHSTEKFLKEEWVLKNPILRQPIQLLEALSEKRKETSEKRKETPAKNPPEKSRRVKLPVLRLSSQGGSPPGSKTKSGATKFPSPTGGAIKSATENDRHVILHGEIRSEMISQILQQMIGKKRAKLRRLVASNTGLLGSIRDLDHVCFFMARNFRGKKRGKNPKRR